MTKSLLFFLIFIAAASGGFAKKCEQAELSGKYNYVISTIETKDGEISEIRLQITNKADNKEVQEIVVKPKRLFTDAFEDCSAVRSYITGKNKNAEIVDNDFGDFIVADFNFDKLEDFAVKQDSGGNGGAFYEFYTQNESGKFEKDLFLTDEVIYFPGTIDTRRKRLITYVHADAAGYNENIFKYDRATQKWSALKPVYRKAK